MENDPENRFEEENKALVWNKLKIKLKAFDGGIVHGDDGIDGRDWIINPCSKKSSSCKALGGHMRVHKNFAVEITENFAVENSENVAVENREKFAVDVVAGDDFNRESKFRRVVKRNGKPTCSICKKSFVSLKSLYGHMRCHPERYWRGMIPPKNSLSSTISSEMIDCSSSYVNLLASLSDGWSVKRRRSEKNGEIDASSKPLLGEYEYGAVEGLMLLANCYKSDDLNDNKEKDDLAVKTIKKRKRSLEDDDKEKNDLAVKTMKKRKRSLEDKATTSSMVKCYKCNICSKVFSTPQALGGHKSSAHTKIPDLLMVEAEVGSAAVSHICKACRKAFPSGQALGGHMRLHYQGPDAAGETQLALITCHDQSTEVPRFDLNELPADQY